MRIVRETDRRSWLSSVRVILFLERLQFRVSDVSSVWSGSEMKDGAIE